MPDINNWCGGIWIPMWKAFNVLWEEKPTLLWADVHNFTSYAQCKNTEGALRLVRGNIGLVYTSKINKFVPWMLCSMNCTFSPRIVNIILPKYKYLISCYVSVICFDMSVYAVHRLMLECIDVCLSNKMYLVG